MDLIFQEYLTIFSFTICSISAKSTPALSSLSGLLLDEFVADWIECFSSIEPELWDGGGKGLSWSGFIGGGSSRHSSASSASRSCCCGELVSADETPACGGSEDAASLSSFCFSYYLITFY